MTELGSGAEIVGRGGSARLRPLVEADGLAEIDCAAGARGDRDDRPLPSLSRRVRGLEA